MFQEIDLQELFVKRKQGDHTLVDVRAPREFHEATIPGSINIPIFTDEERAEVGTIYKQVGQEVAKKRGLEIFSQKLPAFIEAFRSIDTPFTVFCWRGGMRSKTAATVLDLIGIEVSRLTGGIRSYRQWVVNYLEQARFQPKCIVLNGYTGTGKTTILEKLASHGYPVIHLEKIAGHRGSIFGHIGLEPNNQKKFDALLVEDLERLKDAPFVFIEGESKRIGKACLPDFLIEQKEMGTQIFIDLPMEERVKHIIELYDPSQQPERFQEAFQLIQRHIHTPIAKQIEEALQYENFASAIELILQYYYDPKYEYSMDALMKHMTKIEANTIDEAYEQILDLLSSLNETDLTNKRTARK